MTSLRVNFPGGSQEILRAQWRDYFKRSHYIPEALLTEIVPTKLVRLMNLKTLLLPLGTPPFNNSLHLFSSRKSQQDIVLYVWLHN